MATTPDLQEPQIAAARSAAWHQAGKALLTLESARAWLGDCGLLLFAPRSLGTPAPSLVEATLGTEKATIAPVDAEAARGLVARMVAEGSAIPLNLLGTPGDLPDFVVSAAAFPFIFTLRGDKGWKRPPETSGAVKVTPLALRVYELLTEKGAMTVADIVAEAGREVTESAIARSLTELWSMLRVIPALQPGAGDTLWELTTARFSKAVKAGANAGQPTALSALVSLYLGQVYIGSEEEIATFLSPLTARSRVREVLHGLVAGRQLSEAVLDGKAVLYIPDALPEFVAVAASADGSGEGSVAPETALGAGAEASAAGAGRISRFEAGSGGRAGKGDLRGKPVHRETGARSGARPAIGGARHGGGGRGPERNAGGRSTAKGDQTRPGKRPLGDRPRPEGGTHARPAFNRPWDEERASRPPRAAGGDGGPSRPTRGQDGARPSREGSGSDRPARPARSRDAARPPRREEGGDRRSFAPREGGRDRRPFTPREGGGERRPFTPREGGEERRPFTPRAGGSGARDTGGRPPYRRKDENGQDKPFRPRPSRPAGEGFADRKGESRPAPRGDRPYRPRPEGDAAHPTRPRFEGDAGRPYSPRPYTPRPRTGEGAGGADRPRPSRSFGDRPSSRGPAAGGASRGFNRGGDRETGAGRGTRPGASSGAGRFPARERAGGDRPSGGSSFRGGEAGAGRPPARGGDRPSFRPGGAPRRDARPDGFGRSSGAGSGKPGGFRQGRPDRTPRGPKPESEG